MDYRQILMFSFFGNTILNWFVSLIIFTAVFVVLRLLVRFLMAQLGRILTKAEFAAGNKLLSIIQNISTFSYLCASLFVAGGFLVLPSIVQNVLHGMFILAIVVESVRILQRFILFFLGRVWLKDRDDRDTLLGVFGVLVRIALWSMGLLLVLSNLGFDVTSLIASLGIGGVAVALAVQSVLGDIFSSLSIYVDQPFKVGDFIVVGKDMGVVKHIGLKTTRIQALQGEELIISNSELTATRVQNFKRMERRRVVFSLGVTYDTPVAKLKRIPALVKDVISAIDRAEFNRAHFKSFGDSSLDFEVVYYVLSGDYDLYMDLQQAINLGILEKFTHEEISIAFPTRTVHLVSGGVGSG